jgi:hypothetical protein
MSIVLRAWPRIEEFWFDEAVPLRGVDVAWLCRRPTIPEIAQPSAIYTIVVDLTLSDEQLLANMQSETRYEIRRAQNKDTLEFRAPTAPDASSLAAFYDLLAQFAAEKGCRRCAWNTSRPPPRPACCARAAWCTRARS